MRIYAYTILQLSFIALISANQAIYIKRGKKEIACYTALYLNHIINYS